MGSMVNLQMAAPTPLPSMGLMNQMPRQAEQNKPSRRNNKKVSWAPENNLCQVRLFLAEDAPLQAGQIGVQDQLQAKKPWLWHAIGSGFDYDLPPGFGRSVPAQYVPEEPFMVPQTAWRIPPRFVINPSWKVAAGDDSQEIKTQCEREVRFLEAVYPRPSAIPPSPVEPAEPDGEHDDSETPLIPLIPIEEEEGGDLDDSTSKCCSNESLQLSGNNSSGAPQFGGNNNHGPLLNACAMQSYFDNSNTTRVEESKNIITSPSNPTIEPDVAAAAAAAFFAIMRSNEEGKIPTSLQAPLNPPISETKVFVTPEMGSQPSEALEFTNARHVPMSSPPPISSSSGIATSQFMPRGATVPITSTGPVVCKGVPTTSPMLTASPKWTGSQNEQYYKSLIQQHGGPNKHDHINQGGVQYRKDFIQHHGGQQGLERGAQLQPGNVGGLCGVDMNKSKFRKPCLYFNSPKGCRRGASCTFLHELIDRPKIDDSDLQHTKRAKIEIEASGRH
ncbi:hypothetical protein KI387_003046 [Taxus chinensis]|uniref:C3H1-type domain-containing protein n=1 Tax=Taxus chinensis TaxID=29808 RepID=A0AA38GX68_TAXCH|nr:hypothetical protein KI387_003046 [Taxus chinensis]